MEGPGQGTASAAARPLLKWRYASTLTEARLRFKSGVLVAHTPVNEIVAARRPRRADARRNYDALLLAAREAFAAHGADASLEDIARRAGVGIGTLYRNFPSRTELFEAVYADEVDALCRVADEVAAEAPWQALTTWLRRFVDYMATKRAIREAMDTQSAVFTSCRASMYEAGAPSSPVPRQPARPAPTSPSTT